VNLYAIKPEKVCNDGFVLYFYFPWDGFRRDDYEPIIILSFGDQEKAIISRYHWNLMTFWTDLQIYNNKAKISFVTPWHIPIAHCTSYETHFILHPKNEGNTIMKIKGLGLHSIFVNVLNNSTVDEIFLGDPVTYSHLISNETVEKKYVYSFHDFYGSTVIGSINQGLHDIITKISMIN